jgi:hypothetical protein
MIQAQVIKPEGTLSVTSSPSNCSLMINGTYIGKTPITLKRKTGTYTLTFDCKGYKTLTRSVKIISGKTTKCDVKLSRIPSKSLTPLDSLMSLADYLIKKSVLLPAESSFDEEGKGILSFQKNVIKYATHVKTIYDNMVEDKVSGNQTDDELATLVKQNLLKILQSQELEKTCLSEALSIITVMSEKEGFAKQMFNKELVVKTMAYANTSPIPDNNSELIMNYTSNNKFNEAITVIRDGLLDPKVIARYSSFLSCFKNFFDAGDLRLEEIRNNAGK